VPRRQSCRRVGISDTPHYFPGVVIGDPGKSHLIDAETTEKEIAGHITMPKYFSNIIQYIAAARLSSRPRRSENGAGGYLALLIKSRVWAALGFVPQFRAFTC
jgi:hypothetical protein